jgi:hypothetical protein
MFENTTLPIKVASINDTFSAFGVHVYRLSGSPSSGGRELSDEPTPVTAVEIPAGEPVKVYPNPSHTGFTFEINQPATVVIFDATGNQLSSFSGSDKNAMVWKAEGVAPGIYFYHIRTADQKVNRGKIVVVSESIHSK